MNVELGENVNMLGLKWICNCNISSFQSLELYCMSVLFRQLAHMRTDPNAR